MLTLTTQSALLKSKDSVAYTARALDEKISTFKDDLQVSGAIRNHIEEVTRKQSSGFGSSSPDYFFNLWSNFDAKEEDSISPPSVFVPQAHVRPTSSCNSLGETE